MKSHQIGMLVFFILVCFAVGFIGSIATASSVNSWYKTLEKPAGTPPGWVFGPVWSTLYLLMGLAAWLVWRIGGAGTKNALVLFFVQLALNLTWSLLFFGLRNPLAGLVEIVVLWLAIATTLIAFWRLSATAGLLFVPYLGWVSYASYLNYGIWHLNG